MHLLWGFVLVSAPLVLTPGPTTAVVLRNSIAGGARAGLFSAAGANSGSICYGLLTALGFAATLQQWPSAWNVLRWAGVAYLSWLGLRSLRRAVRPHTTIACGSREAPQAGWRSFSAGFLTNVLNPSVAAFYLIVLPQFVPRGAPFTRGALTLMAIHITMAATWLTAWALAGGTLSRLLSRRRPRQILEIVTGIVLLALAANVAL